jgi:hypothetical protein
MGGLPLPPERHTYILPKKAARIRAAFLVARGWIV